MFRKKKAPYGYVLAVIIIVIALVLGTARLLWKPALVDCGTDNGCFKQVAANCAPARFTLDQADGLSQFELTGASGTNCLVEITLTSSVSMPDLIGQSVSCAVPRTNLAAKGYVAINPISEACSGTMKDSLVERFG